MCLCFLDSHQIKANIFTYTHKIHTCEVLCFGRAFNRTQMGKQGNHSTAGDKTIT